MERHDLLDQIRALRADGCPPKVVARALGISKAEALTLVRAAARQAEDQSAGATLAGCWVSRGWSVGLHIDGSRGWPDAPLVNGFAYGLVGVLVARRTGDPRGPVSACGYLVDPYCLGVKNALGPRRMSRTALARFVDEFFSPFDGIVEAPIDLARHLVWGSVAFARSLGFEPHPDLRPAAAHLPVLTGRAAIGFGRDGQPFYVQGPYDDPELVLRTLAASAVPGPAFGVGTGSAPAPTVRT